MKAEVGLFIKYLLLFFIWVADFFYPTGKFILIVGFFITMDSFTGVAAAKRNGTFNSKELRRIIPKFIAYGCAVLVSYVIQVMFFPDFPAMKLVAGLIAYIELVSIDENIKLITGISLFKFFIKKLGSQK